MISAGPSPQLGLDFGTPPRAAAAPAGDGLVSRLVLEGFVPNHHVLDIDRGLSTPSDLDLPFPWSLPSRLFRHPIAFIGGSRRPDGRSALLVRHPLLVDHPFVRLVAARLHHEPGWEPKDGFGRDFASLPRWWHACDLMTDAHWRDLIATRRFTDDTSIVAAVAHALLCGGRGGTVPFDTRHAREVLAAAGAAEPSDWSDAPLHGETLRPAHIVEHHPRTGKVTRDEWAVNTMDRGPVGAWMLVHGIEDGWFVRRRHGLTMSAKGLRRRGLGRAG